MTRNLLYLTVLTLVLCTSSLVIASDLELNFKVDEDFLICHTFSKEIKRPSSLTVIKIKEHLDKKFFKELQFLRQFENLSPAIIKKENEKLGLFLKTAKALPEYKQLLIETQNHLKEVKMEWEKNYTLTHAFMTSLAKIKFKKVMQVFITHPEVYQGRFLEGNDIAWGRKAEWPNYATVYLWHEILHSYMKFNARTHSLIELMTDDALKTHLNGGTYPPFSKDSHPALVETKTWIFEKYWKDYLKDPDQNIFQLENRLIQARFK